MLMLENVQNFVMPRRSHSRPGALQPSKKPLHLQTGRRNLQNARLNFERERRYLQNERRNLQKEPRNL